MHKNKNNTDVLIVGLGPVGDILAALLTQQGIGVIGIDRELDVYQLPRAAVFDDEIMRCFQQLGVVQDIIEHTRPGQVYEFVNGKGETLMRFDRGDLTAQGWAPAYLFHQPSMEQVLRRHLREKQVDLRLGWTLLQVLRNDASGVEVRVADPSGIEQILQARYLIGCDGGASTVRKQLGVELFDYGFEEPWLVVDALMADEDGLCPHAVQHCDPARPVSEVPMSPGRRRWEFMLLPGENIAEMQEPARVESLLSTYVRPGQAQVVRKAVYLFHGLVAKQWRLDSTLLAGDAAHQMPPFLGQGMCSGIRDSINLAWKLTMVIRGEAPATLLDSYQEEREPHLRQIMETAISMGRLVCTLDPEMAAQRDGEMLACRAAHGRSSDDELPALIIRGSLLESSPRAGELFPQPYAYLADGRAGRLDDLLGDGFWLLSCTPFEAQILPGVKAWQWGIDVRDDGSIKRWLEAAGADAVLVRPDRYVAGTGTPEQLLAAFSRMHSPAMDISPALSALSA